MKIMLLCPPSYFMDSKKFERYGITAAAVRIPERPPIGLGCLCEALESHGHIYDVMDMRLGYSYDELKRKTKHYQPDIIGFSMVTPMYMQTYELIASVKGDFPKSLIMIGGPHVSAFRERIFSDCPEVDVCFISESEQSLVEFLNNDSDPSGISGVIYRNGDEIIYNTPQLEHDIDKLGFPKYSKFELAKYAQREIALYTSRGCPYKCVFCSVETFRRTRFRGRSAESIIEEIEYWYEGGYRRFPIEDDNFTFDAERVSQICDEIEKRNFKDISFSLGQGVRGDKVSRELLERMYEVGFKHVTIAVEGGNNKVLKSLRKGEKIEQIEEAIQNACDVGFEVRLLFVVGAQGETWNDIEDSLRIAQKYPVLYSRFCNLVPFPGTELFDWVSKEKLFLIPPEEYLNDFTYDYTEPLYETDELTAEQRRKAIFLSEEINKKLFYSYLLRAFSRLSLLKYLVAFLLSRKFVQYILRDIPLAKRLALYLRGKIT